MFFVPINLIRDFFIIGDIGMTREGIMKNQMMRNFVHSHGLRSKFILLLEIERKSGGYRNNGNIYNRI